MNQPKALKSLNFKSNSNTNLHVVNLLNSANKNASLNNKNDLKELKHLKEKKLSETYSLNPKKKKLFNQIKLISLNKHYDLYQYNDKLNQIKPLRENTDFSSYKNDFINEDADVMIKSNNCFDLKDSIPNNLQNLKLDKNIDFLSTPSTKQDNDENEKKSEEISLLTNKHIINNYLNSNYNNMLSSKNNIKNFNEISNNYLIKEEKRLIVNKKNLHDNKIIGDNNNPIQFHIKNNSNSIYSNKDLIKIDSLKFRKNFSAILNNKKDLYKFLQNDNFPVISKNFEKEKNRLNRNFIFSASHRKKYASLINKSKVSSVEKISHLIKEDYDINLEEEIKNIEEEQKLIPRKCKTGDNSKKMLANSSKLKIIDANKEPVTSTINIKGDDYQKNLKNKFEAVNNKNMFFLTNIKKENNNKIVEEIEYFSDKIILTPEVKKENYLINNYDACVADTNPEKIIFNLPKNIYDLNLKKGIINIKDNNHYDITNEKIKVFQQLPSTKEIPLKRNLSFNFEKNNITPNQESTTYYQEKEDKSVNEFSDLNNNREYQPITSNGNFEMELNKEKLANDLSEINNFVHKHSSSRILTKSLQENQDNKIKKKYKLKSEDIYFSNLQKNKELTEKELNFSKNSLENVNKKDVILKRENFHLNAEDKRISIKHKTLQYNKNEILPFKEFINSNCLFKERVNELENKTNAYNNSSHKNYSVINNSVFKNSVNKSASNFFSKKKFFSFNKDDCSKNQEHFNQLNNIEKFSDSLNVKKIKFVYDKTNKNEKIPQIFKNKIITKTVFK